MNRGTRRRPVLVTGATGFVGGRLAIRLRRAGHPVRALVRPGAPRDRLASAGIDAVSGDVRCLDDVVGAAEGVSRIYHLAAASAGGWAADRDVFEINVAGTENVLRAARRHGVERVVHASTTGVHGDCLEIPCAESGPFNPGDLGEETRLKAELAVRAALDAGLPGVIVRLAEAVGPGEPRSLRLFQSVHGHTFRMFGSGETLCHPAYVDDLIDGLVLAGESETALGRTYILAGPRYVSLNRLIDGVARALGVPPPGGRLPCWPLAAGAVLCETVCRSLRLDPPLHHARVAFFVRNRAFTIARAREELGFAPRVDLDEGLRRTADWCRVGHRLDRVA